MQDLVMATNNVGKAQEMKIILQQFTILSLKDIGFTQDIPEPYDSFNQNAFTKAQTIYDFCGKDTFADDSGICVSVLNNKPGVNSAYFGGLPRSDKKNNDALLEALKNEQDRRAFYQAVICLVWQGDAHFFEGRCEGHIIHEPKGNGGFGYDSIFIPKGYDTTFAELPLTTKNEISHRSKALRKMVAFLEEKNV